MSNASDSVAFCPDVAMRVSSRAMSSTLNNSDIAPGVPAATSSPLDGLMSAVLVIAIVRLAVDARVLPWP